MMAVAALEKQTFGQGLRVKVGRVVYAGDAGGLDELVADLVSNPVEAAQDVLGAWPSGDVVACQNDGGVVIAIDIGGAGLGEPDVS